MKFKDFYGETLMFYSKDNSVRFPNIDSYDELIVLTPKSNDVYIHFDAFVSKNRDYFYFSFAS